MCSTRPLLVLTAAALALVAGCEAGGGDTSTDTGPGAAIDDASPSDGGLGQADPGDTPAGPDDTAAPSTTEPNEDGQCPSGTHPEGELCAEDLCSPGTSTCLDLETVRVCDDIGASFDDFGCPGGQVCYLGICWEPICEPGETGGCQGANVLKCNSLGTEWVPFPCSAGTACAGAGECEPVAPNVVLLVDTSGSMNWFPDGGSPLDCVGASCPPWSLPDCDNGAEPQTRLGKVKAALQSVVASEAIASMRVALQRFPQALLTEDFITPASCQGGYWTLADPFTGLMSGDNQSHTTAANGWFGAGIDQIVPVPMSADGPTDFTELARWFDGVEQISATTGGFCFDASMCGDGPCMATGCASIVEPELRAVGGTPLGKSLFYASEYLRNFVLVEGKTCITDADCASSNHVCQTGSCHDPFATCRQNIVIAFTDGEETENVHLTDFFHPRVQAKRMHYGLGCASDGECAAGATCSGGVCTPPSGAIDEAAMVCETGGLPCTSTTECPDPCITWDTCQGLCTEARVTYTDPGGADRILDQAGQAVPITVHVVDASGTPGANRLIAAYGGGEHFSVDLTDPEDLVSTVNQIIGDTKNNNACGSP